MQVKKNDKTQKRFSGFFLLAVCWVLLADFLLVYFGFIGTPVLGSGYSTLRSCVNFGLNDSGKNLISRTNFSLFLKFRGSF
jgi:hypothetical protein